ncbi:hypothetical protein BsIDN1_11640 [Bacillus safensis]|uniref:Uncharacterized protein n=1 Tax=Bacillus safensis TaxID=561879 RepID=A0A5S9M7N6_BACIA|nr:hypothetical protein BsIDN1_11640 [Bacillus safensis]
MEKDKLEKKHEVMQYLREYNEQEIFYLQYQQKKAGLSIIAIIFFEGL